MNLSCGSGMGNAQLLAHWANRFRCELVELLLRLPDVGDAIAPGDLSHPVEQTAWIRMGAARGDTHDRESFV
jgi:hypothetical protein